MLKLNRKLTASDYSLIIANLVPVVGVWGWGWSPKEVFLVYCLETIIVGIFTLVKMGIVTAIRKRDTWYVNESTSQQPGILFMLFFIMHYGLFVMVQMGIFFGVSGMMDKESHVNAFNFFYKWPQLISADPLIMLGTFVLFYTYRLIVDFIQTRQYRTISMTRLMLQPYGRIFIQQLTVIIGSMFLVFGAGKIFILIFALVKIYCELYFTFERQMDETMTKMEKDATEKLPSKER
jgi:Family of unknown function (DUF6498)